MTFHISSEDFIGKIGAAFPGIFLLSVTISPSINIPKKSAKIAIILKPSVVAYA